MLVILSSTESRFAAMCKNWDLRRKAVFIEMKNALLYESRCFVGMHTIRENLKDETHLKFGMAAVNDLDAVVELYRAAVGTSGCTWNDGYPSRETAKQDLAAGGLYVLRMDNRIIGAVSVAPENELDQLECFTIRHGAREFARITVLSEFRGKGYAKYMLTRLSKDAVRSGIIAWHILVATGNPPAIALYNSLGFSFHDECEMYGNRYYVGEKVL